ncbi:hypothetical protein DFH07DRAFT_768429 [Mycena maculata]|uniref:Uncharacterized protein n=1 Tax=Mycena maculata TaxID=230809 RepID=A0AAD7JSM7_9AGAR|nr:hypothetical protein DFH07DRAFT_768429 [Mycena maculata]
MCYDTPKTRQSSRAQQRSNFKLKDRHSTELAMEASHRQRRLRSVALGSVGLGGTWNGRRVAERAWVIAWVSMGQTPWRLSSCRKSGSCGDAHLSRRRADNGQQAANLKRRRRNAKTCACVYFRDFGGAGMDMGNRMGSGGPGEEERMQQVRRARGCAPCGPEGVWQTAVGRRAVDVSRKLKRKLMQSVRSHHAGRLRGTWYEAGRDEGARWPCGTASRTLIFGPFFCQLAIKPCTRNVCPPSNPRIPARAAPNVGIGRGSTRNGNIPPWSSDPRTRVRCQLQLIEVKIAKRDGGNKMFVNRRRGCGCFEWQYSIPAVSLRGDM